MPSRDKAIRRRALRIQQDAAHPLYVFSLTGEELLAMADVSRISRDDAGKLIGYQRPEVRRHVQDIASYLDGDRVLFPNSIILALSSSVRFTRSRGPEVDDGQAVSEVRQPGVQLHLFGVTRLDHLDDFAAHGVTSFDSTSPLCKAFKDDRDNYYAPGRTYTAIRVPQVEGNTKLQKRIVSGEVRQETARKLERQCLDGLVEYAGSGRGLETVLQSLREYELVHNSRRDYSEPYRETLADCPWEKCPCEICRRLGIHVVLFRGAERNRRRGFHNLAVTYRNLQHGLEAQRPANETHQGINRP